MSKKLQEIAKYLIVIAVVAIISTLFPNNVRFKYEYEQGKTWAYTNLISPFDFPILKSEEEIAADREERETSFSPFYELNPTVAKEQLNAFDQIFDAEYQLIQGNEQFPEVLRNPNRYKKYGKEFLNKIYERGIINLDLQHRSKADDFVINVVSGNVTQQRTIGSVRTLSAAKELLSDELPYSTLKEPEFLYPVLDKLLAANIYYSENLSKQFKEDLLNSIPTTKGIVQKGEMIIREGDVIGEKNYEKLNSFKAAYKKEVMKDRSPTGVFLGYLLLTSMLIGIFLLYVYRYSSKHILSINRFVFIFIWLALYSYLVYIAETTSAIGAYLIPFCIVPIIIKHFFDSRLALFTHVTVILLASFLSSLGYEFTFIQLVAGIVAVLGNVDSRDLSKFFYSIVFIFGTYVVSFLGLSLIQEGNLENIDMQTFLFISINAFLILLAYPLIPLLERLFGFTSTSSLIELSDMDRPLLNQLATTASGTFQHSLQVANLAEAAARAIDADHLLVKVASLYHDIGKLEHPTYFIENQNSINPHDRLSPLQSAKVIIAHVEDGVKLAKKHRLPKAIINFIESHHGTTRTEYFYHKYLEQQEEIGAEKNSREEILFQYPGPLPISKEETIVMIADSVEAACKSLKDPTQELVDKTIDAIVSKKIATHQFSLSELNFEEMEICKSVFKQQLRSIHHVRVEYPKEEIIEEVLGKDGF